MQQAVDTLYAKTIPANVRGFLDLRAGVVKPEPKARKAKPKAEAIASDTKEPTKEPGPTGDCI